MALTPEQIAQAQAQGLLPPASAQQPGIDPQVAQQLFDPMQMNQQMGQDRETMLRVMAEKGIVGSGGIRESEKNFDYGQTKNGIDWLKQNYNPPDYSSTPTPHETASAAVSRRKQTQANRQPSIETEMARGLFTREAPPMPQVQPQQPIEVHGPPSSAKMPPRRPMPEAPMSYKPNFGATAPPVADPWPADTAAAWEQTRDMYMPNYEENAGLIPNLWQGAKDNTIPLIETLAEYLFGRPRSGPIR